MFRRDGTRRAAGASASIGALVVAALIPKCPLCIAAALSAIGVSATIGAALAPIARPLAIAAAVIALVVFARAEWRRRQRRLCAIACAARRGPG